MDEIQYCNDLHRIGDWQVGGPNPQTWLPIELNNFSANALDYKDMLLPQAIKNACYSV